MIRRLRFAWRFRVLPWHLPRGWQYIGTPTQQDLERAEELAKEQGWE